MSNIKVTTQKYNDKIIGINLIVENSDEQDIVQRFCQGGIKINTISNGGEMLGLTFKDLIGKNRGVKWTKIK